MGAELDTLAGALRERLLAEAGRADGRVDAPERIRALVEREAGVLDAGGARRSSAARIAERVVRARAAGAAARRPRGRRGHGQRARARCGSSAAGGWSAPTSRSRPRASCATRSSGSSRRSAAASTRPSRCADARLPDGSRVNVVIPPLALDGPGADDPALPPARLHARRPRRARHAGRAAAATSSRARCGRRCNVLVSGGTGSGKTTTLNALSAFIGDGERDRHDRGRRRAAAAAAARRAPRGAAAERRGPRRGHDPPARAQRAADAARPDRRRRGPRGGGARHARPRCRRATTARCRPSTRARRRRRCAGSRRSR